MFISGAEEPCPWEQDAEDASPDNEDWFYRSISMYQHLLMYNLPVLPDTLAFHNQGKLLALSGSNCRGKQEICVYSLPSKVLCTSEVDQGLNNSRDFKLVAGSRVSEPVSRLEFVETHPISSSQPLLLSSSTSTPGLQFWRKEDDDDQLLESGSINTSTIPSAWSIASQTVTLTDGEAVEVFDICSNQLVSRFSTGRGGVERCKVCRSENIVFLALESGTLLLLDLRQGGVVQSINLNTDGSHNEWSLDLMNEGSEVSLYGVNNQGTMVRTEGNTSVVPLPALQTGFSPPVLTANKHPGDSDNRFAVHRDDFVKIYDASGNEKFVHEGHKTTKFKTRITGCLFHPVLDNTLVTSDTERNIHLWQFENRRANG